MTRPLPAGLRATLLAAALVEAYAGAALIVAPARFVRATYGARGAIDPLTLKFCRTAGIAISCLGALAGLCVASGDAPRTVVATLALYNAAAFANNAGQAGGTLAAAVHSVLALALLRYAADAYGRAL